MVINEINSSLMGKETEPLALDMTVKHENGTSNVKHENGNSNVKRENANISSLAEFSKYNEDNTSSSFHNFKVSSELTHQNSADEELTNLTWLQDTNLLKNLCVTSGNMSPSQQGPENSLLSDSIDESIGNVEECIDEDEDFEDFANGKKPTSEDISLQKSVPYDPLVNVTAKPPYSFSCLIFMAIEDSPNKALPVKEIYSWIVHHFPYFKQAPDGWKNSVRHNLSLNKCFSKLDKTKNKGHQNIGKGSLWCTDPEFRPNLLQALKRAPNCSFSQLDDIRKTPPSQDSVKLEDDPNTSNLFPEQSSANVPSPYLFPYLSKRLSYSAAMKSYEVEAAATMVALKSSTTTSSEAVLDRIFPTKRLKRKFYLRVGNGCTGYKSKATTNSEDDSASHSADHTYSAATAEADLEPLNLKHINNNNEDDYPMDLKTNYDSSDSSSEDERPNKKIPRLDFEGPRVLTERLDEEQRSLTEGAQALMSLANIAKIKRESLDVKRTPVIARR